MGHLPIEGYGNKCESMYKMQETAECKDLCFKLGLCLLQAEFYCGLLILTLMHSLSMDSNLVGKQSIVGVSQVDW